MPINEYDALASGETVAGNEYDQMAQDESKFKQQSVQASMAVASLGPDPDQQARIIELARKTNLPTGVVARQYDTLSKKTMTAANEYDKIVEQTPGLARWLEEPDNATVSKDDLLGLAKVEKASKGNGYIDDLVTSFKYGSANLLSGIVKAGVMAGGTGAPQVGGDAGANILLGGEEQYFPPTLTEQKKIPESAYKNIVTEYLDSVKPTDAQSQSIVDLVSEGEYKQAARALSLQVVANAPQLLMIAVAPELGLPALFESSLGNKAAQNLEAGVEQDKALANAAATAGVETFIESLGGIGAAPLKQTIQALTKSVGRESAKTILKSSIKNIVKTGAEEGAEEFVTSIAQDMIDYSMDVNPDAMKGMWKRAVDSGIVGAAAGGSTAAAVHTPLVVMENYKKKLTADVQKETYLDLGAAISESKLSKRSADIVSQYVETVTKGGPAENIYIPADAFETYFQKTDTPASQVASEMGISKEYNEAIETGADIKIKTSDWTKKFLGTEHYEALADDIKFNQDVASVNEAKALASEVSRADVQAVESNQAAQESLVIIKADVEQKLINAGMKQSEARANSLVWQEFFKAASEQAGISAEELYKRYDVQVVEGQANVVKRPVMLEPSSQESVAAYAQVDEQGNLVLNADDLSVLESRIKESEAGTRGVKMDQSGEVVGSYGSESTFPEFFKNKGYKKTEVLKIIEKQKSGKKLTEKQKETLKDLYDSMIDSVNRKEYFQKYRDQHTSPGPDENLKNRLDDLSETLPDIYDISEKKALQYYGYHDKKADLDVIKIIKSLKSNPNADVKIYRAVPIGVENINDGDWVSLTKYYAELHGESRFDGKYSVIEKTVKAKELYNAGDIQEWGYHTEESKKLNQDVKGQIQFLGKGKFNIALFNERNESTFMHESAHFFLEVMGDLAASEGASQAIKDDYATILKELGVESRQDIKVDQHEQFARSFEAYLMKGEAPSSTLRRVFNKFKVWLTNVYRTLKSLNVEVSPEMTAVFDRMLVAESETIAAQKAQNQSNLFVDPRTLGLSEEDTFKYLNAMQAAQEDAESQLRAKLMDDVLKKHTQSYKEAKAQVTADVEQDLNNSKIYQAISILQDGKLLDGGEIPSGGVAPTLSRESVVATYGEAFAKTLPRGIYAPEGQGLPFDVAAEYLGFATGDSMVNQLANSVPKKQYIESKVAKEMYARFPDLMTSPTLPTEAMEAIHNEKRAKVLRLEAELLAKAQPTLNKKIIKRVAMKLPSPEQLKLQAQQIIEEKTVKEIYGFREQSPDPKLQVPVKQQITPSLIRIYQRAEAKAAKEAMDLLMKGDIEGAFMAKRKEMFNHELYRQAQAAKAEVEKQLNNFKKIYKKSDESLAKSRDVDIVNAAKAVLAQFGIGKKDKTADQYLSQIKAYDPDTYGTVKTLVDQASVDATMYKNVSFERFKDLADSVNALWELSKSTREIEIDGVKMDRIQVQSELEDRLAQVSTPGEKHKFLGSETTGEAIKTAFLSFKSASRRVEHWSQAVDSEAKEFTKYIWNPISEAANKYRSKKNEVITQKYRKTFDLLDKKSMTNTPIAAPEISPIQVFKNKAELLGAILHTGNESNLQKLLRGRSWGSVNEDGTLNTKQWDQFINRMHEEGILTKSDYDWAQSVWDLLEELKPDAQRSHKEMYGFYFNEITAKSFETPFGTYRGGYVPAVADPTRSEAATIRTEKEQMERGQNSWMFPSTGRGFTKNRVEAYVAPLSLQIDLVGGHIDKVLRFTYIEPKVKAASRIVMDEGFRVKLAEFDPTAGADMLVPWLQRSAAQRTTTPSGNGKAWKVADSVFNAIRLRAGMNIMTGNVINTLQNYTGIFVAATKVAPKYLRNATWDYISNSKELAKIASEKSQFMNNELNTTISDAQREINQILVNPTKFETVKEFGLQHAYILQQISQNQISSITWHGAYNQALEQGMTEKEAVRAADSAVRTTQSSLKAEDVSRIEVGTPLMRMFTQFYSYFNNLANLNTSEFERIVREVGLRKGAGKLFYLFMMSTYLPAVTSEILRRVASGTGADDDDDGEYMDDFMSVFLASPAQFLSAQVYLVGTAAQAIGNQFNDKHYDDKLALSPSISAIESSIRAPGELYDALANDNSPKKAVRDTMTLIGLFSGLPLGIVSRPTSYAIDVATGEAKPENPVDFARGLVTGKKGND